jgi:hypothetical protein
MPWTTPAAAGLAGIQLLVDVTGADNLIARCLVPQDSPYSDGIRNEEANNGSYQASLNGKNYMWIGHTSRDQFLGAFFGMSIAYEQIDDAPMRATIADLVSRLVTRLLDKNWEVVMPNGDRSTVFWCVRMRSLRFCKWPDR